MGLIRLAVRATVLVTVVGGSIVAYENRETIMDGIGSTDDSKDTSPKSQSEIARENTTRHLDPTSTTIKMPTATVKTAGPSLPAPIGPVSPSTTQPSNLRGVTVMVTGNDCIFIDDATGQPIHSLMEGEVVRLSTNQNGAGFVGVDGNNSANEYTLAVKLSSSKEPIQLKFGTSIAAQCQSSTDFALLTEPPHQAVPDQGKATIPVTEPYSKVLLNGETIDTDSFAKSDLTAQIAAAGVEIPGLELPGN